MTDPAKNEEAVVVKFTETVSTLALLNTYWLVSALFILPLFSATEALFYCVKRHVDTRETGLSRVFFTYVKDNLFKSLKRQVLPLLVLSVTFLDTLVIYTLPLEPVLRSLLLGIFLLLSLLAYSLFMYQLVILFSEGKHTQTLKNRVIKSFFAVVRYPQYSLSLLLILTVYVLTGLYFVPMLIFFGLSFPAYCYTIIFSKKLTQKSHRMD